MRYAIWNFHLDTETGEKTTPLEVKGICFMDETESQILGYLDESADINALAQWSVTELTQSEVLSILQSKVNDVTVDAHGVFIIPTLNN